jgi:CBS domain containing-hemolysin-like protein
VLATALSMVFGELVPKNVAIADPLLGLAFSSRPPTHPSGQFAQRIRHLGS